MCLAYKTMPIEQPAIVNVRSQNETNNSINIILVFGTHTLKAYVKFKMFYKTLTDTCGSLLTVVYQQEEY